MATQLVCVVWDSNPEALVCNPTRDHYVRLESLFRLVQSLPVRELGSYQTSLWRFSDTQGSVHSLQPQTPSPYFPCLSPVSTLFFIVG